MRTVTLVAALLLCVTASPPSVTLRNGVKMPMVAAGTWEYNSTEAEASVTAAVKTGFTMVDTALDYHNQDGVGRALAAFPRSQVFVETKVPGCLLDGSSVNPFKCYEDTKKNLATDLALLNLSYVDLVIVHFPPLPSMITRSCNNWSGGCEMVRSQWRAMEEFYHDGKARAIGVSNYCPSCFACLESTSVFPMVNQVMYHLGMGVDPHGFQSFAEKHGVVLQAYSVLGNTPWSHHPSSEILSGNLTSTIGRAHGKSPVQVALKWIVDKGVPAVTKSSSPAHLAEDLDLWSWDLTPEETKALDEHRSPGGFPSFACNWADKDEQFDSATAVLI